MDYRSEQCEHARYGVGGGGGVFLESLDPVVLVFFTFLLKNNEEIVTVIAIVKLVQILL